MTTAAALTGRRPNAPIARLLTIRPTPDARLVTVVCPCCQKTHSHGIPWGHDGGTHRLPHCAPDPADWQRKPPRNPPPPIDNPGYFIPPVPPVGYRLVMVSPTGTRKTSAARPTMAAAVTEQHRLQTLRIYRQHTISVEAVDLHHRPVTTTGGGWVTPPPPPASDRSRGSFSSPSDEARNPKMTTILSKEKP